MVEMLTEGIILEYDIVWLAIFVKNKIIFILVCWRKKTE